MYIDLWKNGKSYREAIHRLVALVYCDKPDGATDVDHIDHNKTNNNYKNLRWVSHKENIHHSYEIMPQTRNFRECVLEYCGKIIGKFKSINECCIYAAEHFGLSYSSMNKYRKVGEYVIRCND